MTPPARTAFPAPMSEARRRYIYGQIMPLAHQAKEAGEMSFLRGAGLVLLAAIVFAMIWSLVP